MALWLGLFAIVGACSLVHRALPPPTSWLGPIAWFAIGLAITAVVYPIYEHAWFGAELDEPSDRPGVDAAIMFATAYLMALVIAFDSVVVTKLLLQHRRVAARDQPTVVFWGHACTVIIRAAVLIGVVQLVRAFPDALYAFGVVILFATWRDAIRDDCDASNEMTWIVRFVHDLLQTRPLHLAVFVIVAADVAFTIDSIAALSVTTTAFILVSASVFATIALRGWFSFRGADVFPRFAPIALLSLACAKLLAHEHLHVPPALWLAIVATVFCAGVVEWMIRRAGKCYP